MAKLNDYPTIQVLSHIRFESLFPMPAQTHHEDHPSLQKRHEYAPLFFFFFFSLPCDRSFSSHSLCSRSCALALFLVTIYFLPWPSKCLPTILIPYHPYSSLRNSCLGCHLRASFLHSDSLDALPYLGKAGLTHALTFLFLLNNLTK